MGMSVVPVTPPTLISVSFRLSILANRTADVYSYLFLLKSFTSAENITQKPVASGELRNAPTRFGPGSPARTARSYTEAESTGACLSLAPMNNNRLLREASFRVEL